MTSVRNQTAPVQWLVGQALLPRHFELQEQSLRKEMQLRLRLLRAPYWGVGEIKIRENELAQGTFAIDELSLVLPSGTLVDIPGNASEVKMLLDATRNQTPVYLHLRGPQSQAGSERGGRSSEVPRVTHRLELSASAYSDGDVEAQTSFHLCDMQRSLDGSWEMLPSYIPPMLQVTADSVFFRGLFQRLEALEGMMQQALVTAAQHDSLLARQDRATGVARHGFYELQAILFDARVPGGGVHPYELFSALRGFYIAMCVHNNVVPELDKMPYQHEKLAECFKALLDELGSQARSEKKVRPYVEFKLDGKMRVASPGPSSKQAKDVFLLVKRNTPTTVDLRSVKLAAPSQLEQVHNLALGGVPFQRVEHVPFQHEVTGGVEFYALSPGKDWDLVVKEGKIALFDRPQFMGAQFFLYSKAEG